MNKASLKRHILEKHGPEQLEALGVEELPDKLNGLAALNVRLNAKFGHKEA